MCSRNEHVVCGFNGRLFLFPKFVPEIVSSLSVTVDGSILMTPDGSFGSRYDISGCFYHAALLHDHPELLDDCCELINMEWKRSHVARLRSIGGSSNKFPTSLILLKESSGKPQIVGHCKLSKLSHTSPVIFVDTVVIHPNLRGKGLGKFLMQKAEEYLKRKEIEWVYLTTMGQELFYEKLGYLVCEPITIYGGQLNFLPQNDDNSDINADTKIKYDGSDKKSTETSVVQQNFVPSQLNSFPPPPPPPPPPTPGNKSICVTSKKTFMRKKLFD